MVPAIVQGTRHKGDEELQNGFPADVDELDRYKCIIVGSFPADYFQPRQIKALCEYVRRGRSVIFLGGEHSYGLGGYESTELAELFPWRINPTDSLETGRFDVAVPVGVTDHGIVVKSAELINSSGQVFVGSLNTHGPIKPGAISLMDATIGGKKLSLAAVQRYGQGQVMAVSGNTMWKWTRISERLKQAYGYFWRSGVRYLSGAAQGGDVLSVKWDQDHYSPGQEAYVSVGVSGSFDQGQLHLRGSISLDGQTSEVQFKPLAGRKNNFDGKVLFRQRGEYLFNVQAFVGKQLLESYEKSLIIGPRSNEGANLALDEVFLDDLARRGRGGYFRSDNAEQLLDTVRQRLLSQSITTEVALVEDRGIYFIIVMVLLMTEWIVRRKMNLF